MAGPPDSLFDWFGERRLAAAPGPPGAAVPAAATAAAEPGWRFFTVAITLALAAAAAPAAMTALIAAGMPGMTPLAAGALVGLLVAAPAAAGLVAAACGISGVAARLALAGNEAELAVIRVLLDAVMFGGALAVAAADVIAVAAVALVLAWIMLLAVIRWPAAPPLRRHGALVLDALLLSGFLHAGGGAVAGWYPFYLLAMVYAGLRLGLDALIVSAAASIAGFAAVVATTAVWRLQPALAGGLVLALAAVPASLAGTLRTLNAARARASGAEAQRQTTLRLIAETLRAAGPGPGGAARPAEAAQAEASPPIGDIRDFVALEAGTFAPPVETFDLRALVRHSLMPLRERAMQAGGTLQWRIDALLPDRLRGHAEALARVLAGLAEQALAADPAASVRIALEPAAIEGRRLRLTLRLERPDARRDGGVSGSGALSLRLIERLVLMMEGTITVERRAGGRIRLSLSLPLAIEPGLGQRLLDLARRPVLIATEDDELARDLAEALAVWNAQPDWPADIEAALAGLAGNPAAARPLLIVDGRDKLLAALSLAHRAGQSAAAPLVVLIAAQAQIAGLGQLDEAGLDGFVAAPVSEALLANALDALPLAGSRADPSALLAGRIAAGAPEVPAAAAAGGVESGRITPIAAHPRFAAEAAAVDPRAIEGLRALGGGSTFLADLIDTFRTDARQIVQRLDTAAAAGDGIAFDRGVVGLQRAAGQLGGSQLCELLATLQGLPASELRLRGAAQVRRLDGELARFTDALEALLPSGETRPG